MGIRLGVHLRDNLEDSKVTASGFELVPPNDKICRKFGFQRSVVGRGYDNKLWGAINRIWGRVPDEFSCCDPHKGSSASGVENLWRDWGIEDKQTRVERRAVGCELIETSGGTDSIIAAEVENLDDEDGESQEVSFTFQRDITDTRTSEHHWSLSLTNSLEVEVSGKVDGIGASAKRGISLTIEGGGSRSKAVANSKTRAVTLLARVRPKARFTYPISVSFGEGTLKVRIDYEYRMVGGWVALYIQKSYNGKLASPIFSTEHLLKEAGLPTVIKASEIVDVGFCTDGKISVGKGVRNDV